MKLTILGSGTSTGVPLPGCTCAVCRSTNPRNKRLRTSALLSTEHGKNILIDASTDLRQQALTHGIARVDAVLFTHAHADHILGIDDLRAFNFVQKAAIPCYGTGRTLNDIKKVFHYIFNPDPSYKGGGLARLELHEVAEKALLSLAGAELQLFPLLHGHLRVSGFRVGKLAYATDVKEIPAESREFLAGLKYLILDGLRFEPHSTHLTIPEAIEVSREIGAELTYLIHMTHTIDHDEVNAKLPPNVRLAYDGLQLDC